jgi:hypothetical protein
LKGALSAAKAIVVTTAVYGWLAVQVVREVRHTLIRSVRVKYVQRPIDF